MEDGTSIEDAFISVRDVEFDKFISFGSIKTDRNGNFVVKAFENRKYQLAAILFDKAGKLEKPRKTFIEPSEIIAAGESKIFTLDSTTSNIKLILKESEDFKRIRQKYIGKLILEK